jgi:hypothetical protein
MELSLDGREITSLPRSGGTFTIRCLRGDVWVTLGGEGRDHLLGAGDELTLSSRRGSIVVQGLGTGGTVRLSRERSPAAGRSAAGLDMMAMHLKAQA